MTLIDLILNQYEKNNSTWNHVTHGNSSFRVEMEHQDSIGVKELVFQARELEAKKLLKIVWVNGVYNEDIEKVKYSLCNIDVFYQMSGREPKYVTVARQRLLAEVFCSRVQTNWIRTYFEEDIFPSLDKGKMVKDEERQELIYKCLLGLDQLTDPIFRRVFSKRILGNSKKFERELQKTIVSIARKYMDDIDDNMEEQDILTQLFIETYSQELYIKGKLLLELDGNIIDTGNFTYGTILNTQTMKNAVILSNAHIRKIRTIENKANFIAEPYEDGTLILFTHGYFSPMERRFLNQLNDKLCGQQVAFLHSGDMDYGGICIFRYIQTRIFPQLKPFKMDVETFEKYLEYAEDMDSSMIVKMKQMEVLLLHDIIQYMIEEKKVLEQEAYL